MKKWMSKKIIPLLLAISLAMGIIGVPLPANASEGAPDIDADSKTEYFGGGGYARNIEPTADLEDEATVTIDGVTTRYREFGDAWKAAQGRTATICLLKSVNLGEKEIGDNVDLLHTLLVNAGDNITIEMNDGVQLYNDRDGGAVIQVDGGTFTLESGQIVRVNQGTNQDCALLVTEGNVFINKGTIKSNNAAGLYVYGGSNVSISGGTFIGRYQAVQCESGTTIREILANGRAFFDKNKTNNGDWLRDEVMDAATTNPGGGDIVQEVIAKDYPMSFEGGQPASQTIIYGNELSSLHVEAKIVDQNAFSGNTITYQWFRKTEQGDNAITGATSQDYKPEDIDVGVYEYFCRATCEWFSLDSEHAVLNIKQLLEVKVLGEITKTYDGTNEAGPDLIPPLQFADGGVIGSDSVTASAIKAVYPSADAGAYDQVTVELALQGDHAHNYKILEPVTASGRIIGLPATGISLNTASLSLPAGGSAQLIVTIYPENGTDKTVLWTSSDPSVVSVDSNGKVTAVGVGSAVITVTTPDGKFVADCSVTVSRNSSGGNAGSPSSSAPIDISIRQPFIKGSPTKQGWNEIHMEAERLAAFGTGTVTIDMNGTSVVPSSFITSIRGSGITAVFEMSGGITWSVFGKDISAETVRDTDFSVKAHAGAIPKELIDDVAGGMEHLELRFLHGGAFGFKATLTTRIVKDKDGFTIGSGIGKEYAGMYANLFYYNADFNKLEFICTDKIEEDGSVSLPFTDASDYIVILSSSAMQNAPVSPQEPQQPEENVSVQEAHSVKLSKTVYTYNGKAKKPSVIAVDADGKQIPGKYYTVSYQNNKKVGNASAVIAFKDGYTGTVKKSFTIRPAAATVEKIKAFSHGFTVKWAKKTAQTSGYQIQYSENAAFKGDSTRSVFVKRPSITEKSVKKLKPAAKYYIRIRTYKTVKTGGESKKIYSVWSWTIRVKTRA